MCQFAKTVLGCGSQPGNQMVQVKKDKKGYAIHTRRYFFW